MKIKNLYIGKLYRLNVNYNITTTTLDFRHITLATEERETILLIEDRQAKDIIFGGTYRIGATRAVVNELYANNLTQLEPSLAALGYTRKNISKHKVKKMMKNTITNMKSNYNNMKYRRELFYGEDF